MPHDFETLPGHVGIIMDGNGRWARERGLARTKGHREGLEAAKRVVKRAAERNLTHLSLYTFSTENWRRSEEEVAFLMGLIKTYIRKQYEFYKENKVRILHGGNLDKLPESVRREILGVEEDTKGFTGLKVNVLINYGGRDEIIRSVKRYIEGGNDPHGISEETVDEYLDHGDFPPLDLVIRTAGDLRISNFMIWQSAYAELYFSEDYWPDWSGEHLDAALNEFATRQRRYGGNPP